MGVFDDILGPDEIEEEEKLELDNKKCDLTYDEELKKLLDKVFDDLIEESKQNQKPKKSANKWYPKRVISEYYERNKKSKRA